jgi:hypothetical protein
VLVLVVVLDLVFTGASRENTARQAGTKRILPGKPGEDQIEHSRQVGISLPSRDDDE